MKKITLLLFLLSFKLFAQWTGTPQQGNAIITGSETQLPLASYNAKHSVVVDDAQNIITAFVSGSIVAGKIFVQKTDANGSRLWGDGGITIYDGTYLHNNQVSYTGNDYMEIVPDGAGGAIIAFLGRDYNHNPSNFSEPREIMALRIDGNGVQVWADRVSLSLASWENGIPYQFKMIADENGGAYLGWISHVGALTSSPRIFKLFYQHLHSDGNVEFPDGHLVKNLNATWPDSSIYYFPTIAKTPSGNIAFSWKDFNTATNNWGLFCNVIDPQGAALWANDVLVDTGLIGTYWMSEGYPHQLALTDSGMYMAYYKSNSLRVSFLNNDGTAAFTGTEVSTLYTSSFNINKFDMTTTPSGDAMLIADAQNGIPYLQKVNQFGGKLFGYNGFKLGSLGCGDVTGYRNKIVRTSDNNYLTVFSYLGGEMVAHLYNENGNALFPSGGVILWHQWCDYINLLATNYGGAVCVAVKNIQDGNGTDFFAMQILPANNPVDIAMTNGSSPIAMSTTDNLNFTIDNYAHNGSSNAFVFSKDGLANFNVSSFPSGTSSCTASASGALAAGNYNVSFNALNRNYSFDSTLDANEFVKNEFKIYPNPAMQQLHFSKPIGQIEIYDLMGKIVLSAQNEIENLNILSLSNGIYLIKAKTEEGAIINQKFVKE